MSIDADTVQTIKNHRQQQNADRLAAGDAWKGADNKENGHVFTAAWGEPIHPDTVSSLMASMTARHNKANPSAALPPARLHDLRHIHATTLLLAGVPVHVVAARLGEAEVRVPGGVPEADPHQVRAAAEFAEEVGRGEVPSIRTIKRRMRIGQVNARRVRVYLGVLAERERVA